MQVEQIQDILKDKPEYNLQDISAIDFKNTVTMNVIRADELSAEEIQARLEYHIAEMKLESTFDKLKKKYKRRERRQRKRQRRRQC